MSPLLLISVSQKDGDIMRVQVPSSTYLRRGSNNRNGPKQLISPLIGLTKRTICYSRIRLAIGVHLYYPIYAPPS